MAISESVGFLNYADTINFDGGCLEKISSFQDNLGVILKYINTDGNIYPPHDPDLKRSSPAFRLPQSHILHIENPITEQNVRGEDAGLLLHLIGFCFETRLQFSDWRFDGKVPITNARRICYDKDEPANFISYAYQEWKTWDNDKRKRYINILYMHGKAKSCDWEWDEFMYQYIVFDAIAKLYDNNIHKTKHKERILLLCSHFNIEYETNRIDDIYNLRNPLFHEALWYDNSLGLRLKNQHSHLTVKCLERLNSKLIVAIIGYNNSYSKSRSWTDLYFRGERFDKFSPS